MKLISIRYFLPLLLLISACTGPRTVTLNSISPADITLPTSTKTLLILDRTKSNQGAADIIEGIFTGELPGEDKAGTQELLVALYHQLGKTNRFDAIIAEERLDGNSITSVFPDQLSRQLIDRLAVKYNADAIVAVELLDTDFVITRGKNQVDDQRKNGVDQYYAKGLGNITIGIRLYDCKEYTILDQQLLTNSHTWETTADNVPEAVEELTSKGDATRYLSNAAGREYAYRIAPMPIRIKRSFRGKAKRAPEVEMGTRYADMGQWEKALETWKSGLGHARDKEAGYLAHNIALAYEVLGDFDNAFRWAQTAYARYGNEEARSYASQIRQRLDSEELARKQLGLRK